MAASQWINRYLRCCCVTASDTLDEPPIIRLILDQLLPSRGVCVAKIGCCGIRDDDDNEKQFEVLRII